MERMCNGAAPGSEYLVANRIVQVGKLGQARVVNKCKLLGYWQGLAKNERNIIRQTS